MPISGPPIDLTRWRRGWALFGFGKAHYFEREDLTKVVRSRCGIRGSGLLLEPGDFELCRRCKKSMGA